MSWFKCLGDAVRRNLPSQKPQLWEDPLLSLRRRLTFEVKRRTDDTWLDRPHVIELSRSNFVDANVSAGMVVVPREQINQTLFLYGTFEISETRLIQSLLRPGMTFVDVGANIGYYTVVCARLVGPTGKVHSFEPHSRIRAQLEANVSRNCYRNVVVHPEAMAERSGALAFFVSSIGENQGISSILHGAGRQESHEVPSISLDDFMAGLNPPSAHLVKMDIEGAELQVIRGGSRTLAARDAPAIIFEAAELAPVAEALRAHGYHIRRHHYTLARGLELLDTDAPFDNIFGGYEAPNYVAAKDDAVFQSALAVANSARQPMLRLLGRI